MKNHDIVEIDAVLKHETEKGLLLDCGDGEPQWFPKSMVEDNGDGTFSMPEWLAKDKGVI